MSVVVNTYLPKEVAKVNASGALVEGVILSKSRVNTYDYDLATDIVDGVMLSEIVSTEIATMRQHLMHDIDFSGYTRPGELSAIAKQIRGTVGLGYAFTAQGSDTAVGTTLQVAAGFLAPHASGKKVAIALDLIPAGSTITGRVLVLPVAV